MVKSLLVSLSLLLELLVATAALQTNILHQQRIGGISASHAISFSKSGSHHQQYTKTTTQLLAAGHVESLQSTDSTKSRANEKKRGQQNNKKTKNKNNEIFSEEDIRNFCKSTNAFWKQLVIRPVRDYVEIQPAGSATSYDAFSKLIARPEVPGIPRPVWLTILGSVPTALGWYGYYKFSVEEELFQYELQQSNGQKVSGCGGYGTLFPFVYGIIIGFPLSLLHIPGGESLIQLAGFWILAGQINLYRRVNELCTEDDTIKEKLGIINDEPPLHAW